MNRIVFVGSSVMATTFRDLVIWRFSADGSLDTNFNRVGFVTHHGAAGGNGSEYSGSMQIDSMNRIVVTGRGQDINLQDDYRLGITLDANGRIVVVGHSYNHTLLGNNLADMAVWRYIP